MSTQTLSESIREKLKAKVKGCGCAQWENCPHPKEDRPISRGEISRRTGISVQVVGRFLSGGGAHSDTLDVLADYLEA